MKTERMGAFLTSFINDTSNANHLINFRHFNIQSIASYNAVEFRLSIQISYLVVCARLDVLQIDGPQLAQQECMKQAAHVHNTCLALLSKTSQDHLGLSIFRNPFRIICSHVHNIYIYMCLYIYTLFHFQQN